MTEESAVVGQISPASRTPSTTYSTVVDMSLIGRLVATVLVGAMGEGATLDATFYGNTVNSTSGGTAITGKSLAADTFSGSGDQNGVALIEVTSEEVAAQGFRYVFLDVTTTTAAIVYGAVLTAYHTRYANAATDLPDLAAVREIVY
jgi:hypothetical protein